MGKSVDTFAKRILITGGAGFIGSNMVNIDKLDYCASLKVLRSIEHAANYEFVKGDILDADLVNYVLRKFKITHVIHFAAQTHVDNSFGNSLSFTRNNVLGTHTLLECCRTQHGFERFIHISTDEVYGESAFTNKVTEAETILLPTNPYAATKAGAEHIAKSFYKSWKYPLIIMRCNNIYGPHQYPEKVIPKWICLLERDRPLPIHGAGTNSRHYLFVGDVVNAFDVVLHKGTIGETYNVPSGDELTNLELAKKLIGHYDKTEADYIQHVEDRAFNDQRYNINGEKIEQLGWKQTVSIEEGLKRTVEWYRKNEISAIWGRLAETTALVPHPRAIENMHLQTPRGSIDATHLQHGE